MSAFETPWEKAKRITKHEAQERRIGALRSGEKHPGSGRLWRWKRDGKIGTFLIEARTTEHDSYRISAREFKEIQREGLATPPGLLPAMQIDIRDVSGIFIRLADFDELYQRMLDLEAQLEAYKEADNVPEV